MAEKRAKRKTTTKRATTKRASKKRAPSRTTKAKAASGQRLTVRQVRSEIGHAETYRRTLRAIGLKHYQDVVAVRDTPSMRGMLFKVRHLVSVTAEES